ncbi:cold-shock protein [Nocardia farcinica]|uniref:cold-shock protein n=1 Tax=Nocardia farcinica TaxID=37329 RepID=UPI003798F538
MVQGTVLWFDSKKGFGFIEQDGGGADVFVDYLELVGGGFRSLHEGQRVRFDLRQSKSGPEAVGVHVIG